MYELEQVGECSYYVNCPAKIGIIKENDSQVWLVDSGNDKDAGRKTKKILDQNCWTLKGIINTHSHADHIGGNQYLQKQYGCPIYASGIEAAFTRFPVLEPAFLYGGYPFAELRHKFLMAQDSDAVDITQAKLPVGVEIISLLGHFFDMIGVRAPDGTVFLADCVSSAETLEKYQIGFIYDVAAYLDTLDRIEKIDAKLFVPAHAPVTDDIGELARVNREKVHEIADKVVELCSDGLIWEELLEKMFDAFSLTMSAEQYVLVGSTVRSYLSWLKDCGRLSLEISGSRLIWKASENA